MIISVEKLYSKNKWSNIYKLIYLNGEQWDIPHSEENRHYQDIQKWIAEGGEVIDNPPTE